MKISHKMTITDKLKEILKVKKLRQKDLAGKLNVSEKTMSFWLNGKKLPGPSNEDRFRRFTLVYIVIRTLATKFSSLFRIFRVKPS